MPRFFHGGVYERPEEVADLPFDLLRDHSYPRYPGRVERAIVTAGRQRPATLMMPQRMGFTRFKSQEGGPAAYGENARGAIAAMDQGPDEIDTIYNEAGVPIATVTSPRRTAQSMGLTHLPDPGYDPEIDEEPLPRNVLPAGRMQFTSVEQLERLVQNDLVTKTTGRVAVATKLTEAMDSVAAQRAAIGTMLGTDEDLPWYMR